jgi:hypothetical protein
MGVMFVLFFYWLSGRPLSFQELRRIRLVDVLTGLALVAVPQVTQAIGLGFGAGVMLLLIAFAIGYAWRHFRGHRAEPAPRRSS